MAASAVSESAPPRLRYASSVMPGGLDDLNLTGKRKCLDRRNDSGLPRWYYAGMAEPRHDWYFKQWLEHLRVIQADLVKALDWNKSKASLMFNDKQRYHRDDVNEVAAYLKIEPFELLLPPERAMALRQYRASAEQIVTLAHESDGAGGVHNVSTIRRTGTSD
ncbi:hypothetical protein [Sphingobium sp. AntQ-1]|uniref:hypothetical protein n=1 Tax=Sphingobium sp. AntQ-1 TaxID=2930091 RepID=UPI00234E781C|nr:hypothetical protein [Sphingobium sp. AntQ-1]